MTFAVVPVVFTFYSFLPLLLGFLAMVGGAILALFNPATFKQSVRVLWRLKLPLIAFAAVVYGCGVGVRALLPKPVAAKAEAVVADWSLFRGGPQRLGAVAGSTPPLAGGVIWTFNELPKFYSSPAVVGNRVYCAGSDKGPFTDTGAVYCLDADTGALVWKSAPDGFRATFSSPAISGKYLVVGEGLHEVRDARVFCLDIEQQGKLLWSHKTASHVESTPCIADGRVCIGAGDDGYYCFALDPGADGKAQVLWHALHERFPDAECPPAYYDGKFYVGLGLRGKAIACLDVKTGSELWRIATPYPVFAPPSISNGKLLIGMGNGDFMKNADEAAVKELEKLKSEGLSAAALAEAAEQLKTGGGVWCINVASPQHEVLWRFDAGDQVLGGIAVAGDGKIYFGSRAGTLHVLGPDGKELERWNAQMPLVASPAVLGDYVYCVRRNGKIQAFNRHTLAPEWDAVADEKADSEARPILSSPAVARGHVYIGTNGAGLRCLGTPGEAKPPPIWAGALGGAGKPGHLGGAELPENGSLIWRWPQDPSGGAPASPPKITAPVAVLEDLLCVPVAEGPQRGVVALAHQPNSASAPDQRWHFSAANGVWLSPAIVPGREPGVKTALVFAVDGKRGDKGRQLHCLDSSKGAERWHAPIDADAAGEFSVLGEKVLVSCGVRDAACYDFDGKLCWKQTLGTLRGPAANRHDIAVIAIGDPSKLAAVDLPTGRELWSVSVPGVSGPLIERDTIYAATANGVSAFKLVDGSALWSAKLPAPLAQPLLLHQSRLAALTSSGELLLIDAKSGRIDATLANVNSEFSPLLTGDMVLYFSARENVMAAALNGSEPPEGKRWMPPQRLGAFTAPPVASESCIFFATERRGLIKAGRVK